MAKRKLTLPGLFGFLMFGTIAYLVICFVVEVVL